MHQLRPIPTSSDAPKTAKSTATEVALAPEQAKLAAKYKELERVVLRMAEVMQSTDPKRAALLRQAFAQSKERQIDSQFDDLVKLLKQDQLYQATKGQGAVQQDLNHLLALLMSGDRDKQIPNERAEIKRFIERLNKLIREQQGIQGETEGQGDEQDLAKRQEKAAQKAVELARDLNKFDAANNPEAGNQGEPKDATPDGEKGDGNQKGSDQKDGDQNKDGKSDGKSDGKKSDGKKSDGKNGNSKSGKSANKKSDGKADSEGAEDQKSDEGSDAKSDEKSDSKQGGKSGQKSDGKSGKKGSDAKKSDGKKAGDSADGKSADGKNSDEKSGDADGEQSEGKSGEKSSDKKSDGKKSAGKGDKSGKRSTKGDKSSKSDGSKGDEKGDAKKSDDEKSSDEKSDDQKSADEKSGGEKSDSKSPDSKKSGSKSKSGQKSDNKSGKSQKGSKDSKGEPQDQQSEEQNDAENQPDNPEDQQNADTPARKRVRQAEERMREAKRKLEEAQRRGAAQEQQRAIEELKQAKAALEEILRQLREEEIERTLAMLEGRFRKMLQLQAEVYEGTIGLDRIPDEERDRNLEIESGKLGRKETGIVAEADKALSLLHEEGSSVAFPESVEQMREDMESVATRLGQAKVGQITQGIEQDIVKSLEEMVAALQRAAKRSATAPRGPTAWWNEERWRWRPTARSTAGECNCRTQDDSSPANASKYADETIFRFAPGRRGAGRPAGSGRCAQETRRARRPRSQNNSRYRDRKKPMNLRD